VRNYLALLGGGYDEATTFFTTEELIRNFSLEKVSKSPAVFDEQKLRWMNGRYVRELAAEDLTARLEALTGRSGLRDAVRITQEKISTLDEFWPLARSFFEGPVDDPAAREKFLRPESGAEALRAARGALAELPAPWTAEAVEEALRGAVEASGMKAKAVFQPLRVALTGTTISPGIFETVALLGPEAALSRIDAALDGVRGN
jgi:glutamyl/glutaminyl-tRNA synthetase